MRRSVPAGSRGKVLVVDDEEMLLEMVGAYLETAGYAVATATSAVGLPQTVLAHGSEVVVLDVGRPGLGGEPALRRLRQELEPASVAIILHSGEDEDVLRDLADRTGADGAVAKAWGPAELVQAVERAVATARVGAEAQLVES